MLLETHGLRAAVLIEVVMDGKTKDRPVGWPALRS
jgi:hypothetical protein